MNNAIWQSVTVDESFIKDPRVWLVSRMNVEMPFLLVHADDGVIWGKLQDDGTLRFSSDAYNDPVEYPAVAVSINAETLQQVRIFGPAGELFVWREGGGFFGRQIADGPQRTENALPDEIHLLWGDRVLGTKDGFSLLIEGQRGLTHAVPPVGLIASGRFALVVRHYVDYDDQDQAFVCLSRLVDLIRR